MPESLSLTDLSNCFSAPVPPKTRRLAWEGVSFCVPSNWEVAVFEHPGRDICRLEIEDEYAVRLEVEWTRSTNELDLETIMKRYETASKSLTVKAEEQLHYEELPQGWYATQFVFRESHPNNDKDLSVTRHDLVTAFHLSPDAKLFGFFLIHVLPGDTENPKSVTELLVETFEDHNAAEFYPYSLFDINFRIHRDFKLEKVNFDIGMKHMLYTWKRRRYFLWVFSCADMFLNDDMPPEKWAAGYLNSYSGIRGPIFRTEGREIRWRRPWSLWPGHYEELFRLCFRYMTTCYWNKEAGLLWVTVFHHRTESDLAMLPELV